jgi:hypothetical protein
VDRIDEASAALLAALAHKTQRHPLVIALTVARESDDDTSASLRFLRLVAAPIAVDALVSAQTEALLRSVFGDVPGLPLAAGRIHALSHGNPTDIGVRCGRLQGSPLVGSLAAVTYMIIEGRRIELPRLWLYIVLMFAIHARSRFRCFYSCASCTSALRRQCAQVQRPSTRLRGDASWLKPRSERHDSRVSSRIQRGPDALWTQQSRSRPASQSLRRERRPSGAVDEESPQPISLALRKR